MRAMTRLLLLCLVTVSTFGAVGCNRKAKTPEDAYARFTAAVSAHDGAALFDALDQKTRWAWISIQKYHREAYDIVLSNYPEGQERERAAHRFEPGATATSARELFAAQAAPALFPTLAPLAAPGARIEASGGEAAAVLASGTRVPLARGEDGSWGYAGSTKDAEEQKVRAFHDLEVVRASAADYERAATRAGK